MPNAEKTRTDWELVEAIRAGSDDAFTKLVERYHNQIAHFVSLSLGTRQDAEDVTQEVFFRFYQSLDRLTQRDSVFPWLYRIAVNLCIDESRKRAIRRILSLDILIGEGRQQGALADRVAGPHEQIEQAEENATVHEAIARLPVASRTVLLLRDFEDLPYQEIADILNISISTVKSRLFRARKRLASLYRSERSKP